MAQRPSHTASAPSTSARAQLGPHVAMPHGSTTHERLVASSSLPLLPGMPVMGTSHARLTGQICACAKKGATELLCQSNELWRNLR